MPFPVASNLGSISNDNRAQNEDKGMAVGSVDDTVDCERRRGASWIASAPKNKSILIRKYLAHRYANKRLDGWHCEK